MLAAIKYIAEDNVVFLQHCTSSSFHLTQSIGCSAKLNFILLSYRPINSPVLNSTDYEI